MTPSNLDLASEIGATVPEGPFGGSVAFSIAQLDAFAERIRAEAATAQPDHRAALENLKAVGSKLANCAFNLSQRIDDPMTRDIATTLGQLQRDWDAANIALRQALAAQPSPAAVRKVGITAQQGGEHE